MRKIYTIRLIFLLIFLSIGNESIAQFVYKNGYLTFAGPRHNGTYMTTWNGWAHAWVDAEDPNKFLTFVLSNTDPRIASSTGFIAFYDTENYYNKIKVSEVFTSSDKVLKSNIQSVGKATPIIMNLRPVSYNMRGANNVNPRTEFGFIAQEVEQVIPEIVIEDDNGIKLLNYTAIIPILTATIQELNQRIEELEAKIDSMSK